MTSRTTGERSDLLEVLVRVRSEVAKLAELIEDSSGEELPELLFSKLHVEAAAIAVKLAKHRLSLEAARSRDAADEG